jgi:hypothetical protein
MIWFWTRGQEDRRDTERFKEIEAFRARWVLLEHQLEAKSWRNSGRRSSSPKGFCAGGRKG